MSSSHQYSLRGHFCSQHLNHRQGAKSLGAYCWVVHWVRTFMMLKWRWAPFPAVVELSFGRKLAIILCLAATAQIASLVYSSASVAWTPAAF